MEWFLKNREKSVAQSAQRVVADMHRALEKQNKKVRELESVITQFNKLFTDSLESDLARLEQRKKDLAREMETIDVQIADRRGRLQSTRAEIYQIIAKNDVEHLSGVRAGMEMLLHNGSAGGGSGGDRIGSLVGINGSSSSSSSSSSATDGSSGKGSDMSLTVSETRAAALEEQYMEESEMLAAVKEIGRDLLFIVHRNNVSDIIVYSPSANDAEIVSSYKLTDYNDKNSITELTTFEAMMAYGAKIVPNHDRDFPHIKELAVPYHVNETHAGAVAQLVGAVEIPLTPDVIIDVWRGPDQLTWATTSVNGVSFAVLERMFVTSEVKWGVPTVTQVDLFGRDPKKGEEREREKALVVIVIVLPSFPSH